MTSRPIGSVDASGFVSFRAGDEIACGLTVVRPLLPIWLRTDPALNTADALIAVARDLELELAR